MNQAIVSVIGVVILIVVLLVLYFDSRKNSNIIPMDELLEFETDSEGNIVQGTLSPRASALMESLIEKQEKQPGIDMEEAYSQAIHEQDDPAPFAKRLADEVDRQKNDPDQIERT